MRGTHSAGQEAWAVCDCPMLKETGQAVGLQGLGFRVLVQTLNPKPLISSCLQVVNFKYLEEVPGAGPCISGCDGSQQLPSTLCSACIKGVPCTHSDEMLVP